MMSQIQTTLKTHGFKHYEISNFCKPGKEARHNMSYWDNSDYLGLGAGAHSFVKNDDLEGEFMASRWSNYALPEKYIETAVSKGCADSWSDKLTR
jgi:oxygen-independent coproporphyrinogen-3 oxidase